jgi:hypothetical protein
MIVSGRKMDPEPIQDILMSLEMTNETKKRLDNLQGWAKDLKVRVSRRRRRPSFGIFLLDIHFFKKSFSLLSISLSLSLSFLAFAFIGCRDYATIFFF